MDQDQQQKYIEYQILNNQIRQFSNQLSALDQQIQELKIIENGLIELKKNKEGSSLLIPIGSGVFVEGELKNNKDVLLNVGTGIVVKKSFDEMREILTKQILETESVMQQLEMEAMQMTGKMKELQESFKQK